MGLQKKTSAKLLLLKVCACAQQYVRAVYISLDIIVNQIMLSFPHWFSYIAYEIGSETI
jgi:hypothetical protein